MTRPRCVYLVALSIACLLSTRAELCYSAGPLPPLQTLNFDFGGDGAYVGDDGAISSPGGTYWNSVSASDLLGPCCGGEPMLDEFGQPTVGSVFTGLDPGTPLWADSSSPSNQGPRSDGIQPFGTGFATLTISRVRTFEEMIIYLNGPVGVLGPSSNYGGGTGAPWYGPSIIEPFPYVSGSGSLFPGLEGNEFLRITTPPILGGGLGESPTLTIILEDPQSIIAAIQIRGRFQGAPEPSGLVLIVLGSSAALIRRRPGGSPPS